LSDPFSNRPFPRMALLGAAALVGFALLAASGARFAGFGTTELTPAAPAQSRDLRFEDRPDGSVAVIAASENEVIDVVEPGYGGFVRGVLRGLGRQRKLRDIGPEPPYRLTRWDDGRLSLIDPTTGVRIDLEPFGPTNTGAFARFLSAGPPELRSNPEVSMQE